MALAGNAFKEPRHRDSGYHYENNFTIIKCSLDLTQWRDKKKINRIKIKVLNLFKQGYLSRIILTIQEEANVFNNY